MGDEQFVEKYEELLSKGYCDCNEMNCIDNNSPRRILNIVKNLQQENQELKKQLEYLRSGEYLNQLKFERNMLEDVVNKGEVSKEDKEFIDMTHRNTELLEQQKEFIEWLELMYKETQDIWYIKILNKYKEIIGKGINVGTKGDEIDEKRNS